MRKSPFSEPFFKKPSIFKRSIYQDRLETNEENAEIKGVFFAACSWCHPTRGRRRMISGPRGRCSRLRSSRPRRSSSCRAWAARGAGAFCCGFCRRHREKESCDPVTDIGHMAVCPLSSPNVSLSGTLTAVEIRSNRHVDAS